MAQNPNIYRCDDCGWIYRPGEHNGLDLDDQDATWTCEQCQAGKDHFQIVVPPDDDLASSGAEDKTGHQIDLAKGRVIYTKSTTPNVATLKSKYDKGRLDPQPGFQRYEVWTVQKNSRLIESILLGLPIPILYFSQESDGSTVVVDGQQRLMALFRFIEKNGGYALKGLGPLKKNLEGKLFSELPDELQERIEDAQLTTVEILKESDPGIKFDLFERLNIGATSLNDQELRNCVYRGPYNDYVKDLASEVDFRSLLSLQAPHKRMADAELALRFLAFYHQGYRNHDDKNTTEFLNRQMRLGKAYSPEEREKAKRKFKQATALAITVFGDKAFKRFASGDEENPRGKWEGRNNRALLDVQLYGFTQHGKGVVTRYRDAIYEAAVALMASPDFSDLVTHTISEKRRVIRRFELWLSMLNKVLSESRQGPRLFDRRKREQLFKQDPTCVICSQKITTIDDSEVDHRVPYAKGGKTADENAGLAHRFCNRSKGDDGRAANSSPPARRKATKR